MIIEDQTTPELAEVLGDLEEFTASVTEAVNELTAVLKQRVDTVDAAHGNPLSLARKREIVIEHVAMTALLQRTSNMMPVNLVPLATEIGVTYALGSNLLDDFRKGSRDVPGA